MKCIFAGLLCFSILFSWGCGEKGTMKDARLKILELKRKYTEKSEKEIDYYDPISVDVAALMRDHGDEEDIREAQMMDYIKYYDGQWKYLFSKAEYDEEQKTLRLVIKAQYFHLYYRMISRKEIEKYEKKKGKEFDPSARGVEKRELVEVKEIYYTYNTKTNEWEETGSKIVYPVEEEYEEE